MKKIILIPIFFLLIIPVLLLTGSDFAMSVSGISLVEKGARNYEVSLTVRHSGLSQTYVQDIPVLIAGEHLHVEGPIVDGRIDESDFLYAGMSYDLNNDGDITDIFQVNKIRGVMYLNDIPLKIIRSPHRFNNLTVYDFYSADNNERLTRLGPSALPMIVYAYESKRGILTLGLGTAQRPLTILKEKNPCVKVEALIPAEGGLKQQPRFRIGDGENRLTYSNEKLFEGRHDQWVASAWTIIPLPLDSREESTIVVPLQGITPPFMVRATAFFSIDHGMTLASKPSISLRP
jgi:hypothetical protein